MAFSVAWDNTTPPGPQDINLGDDRIREYKVQVYERLIFGSGGGGTAFGDVTGTRTVDTDPIEMTPAKIDTVSLDPGAGGYNAVARACTYVERATLAASFNLADPENTWQSTGLTITIPGTVLMASGLEHTNGVAASSSDFAIHLSVQFHARVQNTGNSNDYAFFRIRNTTNNTVIGPGSTEALGVIGTDGVRSREAGAFLANASDLQWIHFEGIEVTGRTAATTYSLEVCGSRDSNLGTFGIVASANSPAQIMVMVFKR